jgi:hypothetical protein
MTFAAPELEGAAADAATFVLTLEDSIGEPVSITPRWLAF